MLQKKSLGKIIGMKKTDFNELIKTKEITLSKPRLIPLYKLGDEMALTSVLLSALRLIKEFREMVFAEAKVQKGGSIYFYTEVAFKEFSNSRLDGLILIVKAGTIREAIILEVKNGKDELYLEQIERYQGIAKRYGIPKFLTISNQFVTDPSQSPLSLKNVRGLDMYHFSWSFLLTIAHVLLFKNDNNISDEDQIEIMREVVNYLEADKSGVLGINQMKAGWAEVVDKINTGASIKVSDDSVQEATLSWQQQERDMALMLSRELGVLVNTGETKYKGKLEERLKADRKELVGSKLLSSLFRVSGAVSNIEVHALFEKRTVEMVVSQKPPADKTLRGQLGWLRRQVDACIKRDEVLFNSLSKELHVDVLIRKSPNVERFSILDFDTIFDEIKGKEIREFKILYLKDMGKQFSAPKKFVEVVDKMLTNFYKGVVQHLVKWEPSAPKMEKKKTSADDETFIDEVNKEFGVAVKIDS